MSPSAGTATPAADANAASHSSRVTPVPGETAVGVAPNELTSGDHRDPIAGTPYHKHVPARLEPVSA
jgi:hypothetical protein